jgi:hypothetical protein
VAGKATGGTAGEPAIAFHLAGMQDSLVGASGERLRAALHSRYGVVAAPGRRGHRHRTGQTRVIAGIDDPVRAERFPRDSDAAIS